MLWCTLRALAVAAMFAVPSTADEPMFVRYVPGPAIETFGSNSQKSPEPTQVPFQPGVLELREVVQTSTCGYIDGLQARPVECVYPGAECRVASAASAAGCCLPDKDDSCTIATACLPRSSSSEYLAGDTLRTHWCGDATAPYCGVYSYRDPKYDGYTMHFCNSVSTTEKFYFQPIDMVETIAGATVTVTGDILQDVSTSESASSTDQAPGPTTTTAVPGPAPLPVAPIVGGIVGGIAGIALIVFLAWFLLVRRKRKDTPTPQGYSDVQQPFAATGQHPPVMMANPASPGYDNSGRASIFKPPGGGYYASASPVSPGVGLASPSSPPIPYDQLYQQQPPPLPPQQYQPYPQVQSPVPSHPGPGLAPPPVQGGQVWHPSQGATELPVTRPDGELRELQ
ncbi:hypothetical protein F5X68DRAFT_259403 [Plectosphaerella plurivora]|uniref:Uncharacterized protein n=1 Tax=Plectosphaerella plurivora TaxID=936078 RepID=A0A9P8VF58_9PEZI|nr:hypothetical protein F5X68DRAFT_259403 [Plectosphaerella plurivora]